MGRVDDDEHLRGEVGALPVEHHARDVHLFGDVRMFLGEEVERREPVLAVDDQKFSLGLAQKTDRIRAVLTAKAQHLVGEEQDRAGDKRLADGGLVKIDDLADLPPVQHALEGLLGVLDAGDEARDLVVAGVVGRDLLALEIVAAGKAHAVEQLGSLHRAEVKGSLFLDNARREHAGCLLDALYLVCADIGPGGAKNKSRPNRMEKKKNLPCAPGGEPARFY